MSTLSIAFPGIIGQESVDHPSDRSFQDILSREKAFYRQPNYLEATRQEFSQENSLPVTYTWNTENKVVRVAKQILSVIFFPVIAHQLLHGLAGKKIVPASSPGLMGLSKNHANESRSEILIDGEWKYKRITVEVDGYKIDAVIVGKESTLNNGRWVLASNGNGEFYEDMLRRRDFKQILSEVRGNAIVFNYPGVGASSGLPNRQAMAKAYRAMLAFLEDRQNGVGAHEIIGYGHSIGGGVQGDALKTHELKKDVKYIFIKSRTFSNLSTEVSKIISRPLGFMIKLFGWNIDSTESSKKLQAPEIIMQTADVLDYEELQDSSKIIDDGVIPAGASLAKALLEDKDCSKKDKVFIGMSERHNVELYDPSFLERQIERFWPASPITMQIRAEREAAAMRVADRSENFVQWLRRKCRIFAGY